MRTGDQIMMCADLIGPPLFSPTKLFSPPLMSHFRAHFIFIKAAANLMIREEANVLNDVADVEPAEAAAAAAAAQSAPSGRKLS